MIWPWFSVALALEPPPRPVTPSELPDMPDCPHSLEMTPGDHWEAPSWLVDPETGLVQCRAVVEPYTSLARLLDIETSYRSLRRLYLLDTVGLESERDGWKYRAEWAEAELAKPVPLGARPWVNQVLGAGQVLVTGAIIIWGGRAYE